MHLNDMCLYRMYERGFYLELCHVLACWYDTSRGLCNYVKALE